MLYLGVVDEIIAYFVIPTNVVLHAQRNYRIFLYLDVESSCLLTGRAQHSRQEASSSVVSSNCSENKVLIIRLKAEGSQWKKKSLVFIFDKKKLD